jgi:hypothetical protein
MNQFYPLSKTLFTALFILSLTRLSAQSPTTVTNGSGCVVVQDFNTVNGNFSGPSIFRPDNYGFYWSGAGPGGQFSSSPDATVAPYEADIISPVYSNSALEGTADVGFSYTAPAGTLYKLTVIHPNPGLGTNDIVAITSEGEPLNSDGSINWATLPDPSGTICLHLADADLHAGQNLRFEFTFYITSTAAPVTFDNFALNDISAAPLPVTFQGIIATREKNTVGLKWDVGTEENVREYRIEKSSDGNSFSVAGTVAAERKSVYNYNDFSAGEGVLYYRLRSVDLDGKFILSPIVKLVNNDSYSSSVRIYPSPARNQITVQHKKLNGNARVTISTMDGRMLKTVRPATASSNTILDISSLSTGMYILRLDNGNGKIETTTFVKQ